MENIYMLSDSGILQRMAVRMKEIRLKQNMSQQTLAQNSGVSLSSVVRLEDGNIKSFDTLLRVLRTLGKLEILTPLIEEEQMSPNEYFKLVNETKATRRKRATKSVPTTAKEELEW